MTVRPDMPDFLEYAFRHGCHTQIATVSDNLVVCLTGTMKVSSSCLYVRLCVNAVKTWVLTHVVCQTSQVDPSRMPNYGVLFWVWANPGMLQNLATSLIKEARRGAGSMLLLLAVCAH